MEIITTVPPPSLSSTYQTGGSISGDGRTDAGFGRARPSRNNRFLYSAGWLVGGSVGSSVRAVLPPAQLCGLLVAR